MWLEGLPMWHKILIYFGITLFILALIISILVWIIFPIVFKNSKTVQRFLMFINVDVPKNPDYNNPVKCGIEGVVNFYITTKDLNGKTDVSLGAWLILQADEMKSTLITSHGNTTARQLIAESKKPVVLYLHGVACNRVQPIATYKVLREFFLIVAVDHRGYGDSDKNVELSELEIINDCLQIYKWIKSITPNDLYVWGHSLGAALSVHTVRKLKELDIVPMGLILESPFSTMKEQVMNIKTPKIYKCCGCLNNWFLEPLQKHGFLFESTVHITHVDCPILIMHAEDDNVISYKLGKKLYEVARTQRNLGVQGSVTYHQFPPFGYGHAGIVRSPKVHQYIEFFSLMVLLFLVVYVLLPVIFMCSVAVQRMLIFTHFNQPRNKSYYDDYRFPAFRNLYINYTDIDDNSTMNIGTWHMLPMPLSYEALHDAEFDFGQALQDSNFSVLIYFHGTGETRTSNHQKYQLLTELFHVIAFDYRSYGDSKPGKLYEKGVVRDGIEVYLWVRNQTNAPIYIWGHSLGAAIAAETTAYLNDRNLNVSGLILESAFTSLEEELYVHPYGKLFAWLPWFKQTILNPLRRNHFIFDSAAHIKNLTYPIMILHAADDPVIPVKFGRKLYEIASNRTSGGENITFYHEFSKDLGYGHLSIHEDPFLIYFIMDFLRLV